MNLSSYTTKTYGNKSRLLTMAKQTQSNPICSELACPEQVPISRDASKGSNLPVVSLSNLFYRHSVWRKFIKNPLEFLIDFSSNQLWHKSLKQNQPRQISAIQAIWRTIGAISRAFRVLFGSNSRVIRDNWRYGARFLLPVELCDNRRVVAGLFGKAWLFVYIAGGAFFRQRLCRHNVVQSPAQIPPDRIGHPEIPKRILPDLFAVHPEDIRKSPFHNRLQRLMNIRMKTDVAQ